VQRDTAAVAELEVQFEPTIAFCTWYNFKQLKVKATHEENLAMVWQLMLKAFSRIQITNSQLSALLAASLSTSLATAHELEPLLLLQHILALSSRSVGSPHRSARNVVEVEADACPIRFLWGNLGENAPLQAQAISIQQLAEALVTPLSSKDLDHDVLLRCALLLVHLLGLLKKVAPGVGPVEQALWHTLSNIGHNLQMRKHAERPAKAHSHVTILEAAAHAEEEEQLSLKLVGLLMPTLRSSLKGNGQKAAICLAVLTGLMPSAKPHLLRAVSSELLRLGET